MSPPSVTDANWTEHSFLRSTPAPVCNGKKSATRRARTALPSLKVTNLQLFIGSAFFRSDDEVDHAGGIGNEKAVKIFA